MIFKNRAQAADLLAERLRPHRGENPLVLGIPRGGVPMARRIAEALGARLDVVLVHKLRAPAQPEFAIGAVDEQGRVTQNVDFSQFDPDYVRWEIEEQIELLKRRRRLFTPGRAPVSVRDEFVIVVDDGIATGSTLIAALRALRQQHPRRLVVATAVASPRAYSKVASQADQVVCLQTPSEFVAVAHFFEDFGAVSDEEAARALSGQGAATNSSPTSAG